MPPTIREVFVANSHTKIMLPKDIKRCPKCNRGSTKNLVRCTIEEHHITLNAGTNLDHAEYVETCSFSEKIFHPKSLELSDPYGKLLMVIE